MAIVIDGNNTPTAGGIGYGDGTELAFTTVGSSGQVLTSAGSSAPTWTTPSAGAMTFISTTTASNSATVDIEDAMTAYDVYVIECVNVVNATDNTNLQMRLKIGGAYITTSTYLYANAKNLQAGGSVIVYNSLSDTSNLLIANVSNSAVRTLSMTVKICTPSSATTQKQVSYTGNYLDSAAYTNEIGCFFGNCTTTTIGALTGIRIFSSSGNITSGTFRLYGIANS
jgi:hypothetical protein